MGWAAGKSALILDEGNTGGSFGAPSPHHKVGIIDISAGGKTLNSHAHVAGSDQTISQRLRCRDGAGKHISFPTRTCKVMPANVQGPTRLFVERIEDRFGVDPVGAKREWLHGTTKRLCFADCGERRKRCVECRNATSVETSTMAACALTRQGLPGPQRIVCPVHHSLKAHQLPTNSSVATRQDPVEIGMHMICTTLAQKLIRSDTAKSRQRLGTEPGVGGKRRTGYGFDTV